MRDDAKGSKSKDTAGKTMQHVPEEHKPRRDREDDVEHREAESRE